MNAVPASTWTLPRDPLARFRAIYDDLNVRRSWHQDAMPLRYAAIALTLAEGEPYQIADRLYTAADELKARTGWFGPLRSSVRFVVAAALLRRGEHVGRFCDEVERVGQMFRDAGLRRGSIYEVLAILILQGEDGERIEPAQVARFAKAYASMKEHHWFLTGPDDYPACALLARRDESVAETARRVEGFYDGLRAAGLPRGEALQLASHLLCVNPAAPQTVLARFRALHAGFRGAGIAMWQADFDELAVLTLLEHPPAVVVERVTRHREVMRGLRPKPDSLQTFSLACDTAFLSLVAEMGAAGAIDATAVMLVQSAIAAQHAAAAAEQRRAAAASG